jgi:hypothetical protein
MVSVAPAGSPSLGHGATKVLDSEHGPRFGERLVALVGSCGFDLRVVLHYPWTIWMV